MKRSLGKRSKIRFGVAASLVQGRVVCFDGGVAEWLRRSVSNHARSTRVGSKPVVGAINLKPIVNSAVHPSVVGK